MLTVPSEFLSDEKLRFGNFMKYFRSVTNGKLLRSRIEIKSQSETVLRQSKFLIKGNSQLLNGTCRNLERRSTLLSANKSDFEIIIEETKSLPSNYLEGKKENSIAIEKNVSILDPINVLKRGFSITLYNGKALKSYTEVKPTDKITTVLADGQLESEVKTSDKSK